VAFDAIILAGARSERLSGADKAAVVIGGQTLLERAVAAVQAARRVFVVGPRRGIPVDVEWVQEGSDGGPVAAIAAGVRKVQSEITVVLAVDYPLITQGEVARLIVCMGRDGAIACDGAGRRQPLLAAYDTEGLRTAMAGLPFTDGARVRDLVASLDLNGVELGDRANDCDTWEEIGSVTTPMIEHLR
jgi:molybdopterin-guanine dinucleotide biosynthesis protein A